ncbi:MAG: trimethylamine methyltransferase family protein [Chloroflexi bacterium]|nr:trimethylamine methyltransferase family protein [Chloroflexota bacterium]
MRFQSQLLSEDEKEQVHQETLRILFEAGVLFHSAKALNLLEANGARVDWEGKIAYIPREIVTQALSTAPRSFVLGARNPAHAYPLPSPVSRYALDGTGAFAQDFYTGKNRYGTDEDNARALRVFHAMDMGVMAWAPVSAEDKPAGTRPLHEFFSIFKNTSKHGQHEVHYLEQTPYLAEGLITVMGSEDEVRRRYAYSLIYCPIAPLMHDGPMMDAYIELGALDMPVMTLPMPVTGTTGPVSLFGNICVANAEALSTIIIFQLAHPGRPVIYSSATGTLDLRNGAYMGGTPEMGLMSAALAEMGRFYGLPSTSAGCTSDAHEPGPDAVLEKAITSIAPVLGGSDIIVGFGQVQSDQLLVLEQIVVDNEIAHFCERIFQGVDVSPEKVLTEDILKLGPGGNFLTRKSTRNLARSGELYFSPLLDRHTLEQWTQLGKPGLYSNARKQVENILAEPMQDPLPGDIAAKLDEILAKADKELA